MDYSKLLNIGNADRYNEIVSIINNEKDIVKNTTGSFEALCKFMANNIKYELDKVQINNYVIDLNEIGFDHVFLIAEYNYDGIKRVLIDPTFNQFNLNEEYYQKNKDFFDNLINDGYTFINDELFSKYLFLFSNKKEDIKLDEYLINEKTKRI